MEAQSSLMPLVYPETMRAELRDDPWVINRKEIRVAGIPRSGQHAIIQWILHQAKTSRYVYLNACQDQGCLDPYIDADHNSIYRVGRWDKKDLLLFSFEGKSLGAVFNNAFEREHDSAVGRSGRRFDLLILRDPYNNFASLFKWGRANGWTSPEWIAFVRERWKEYAREYLHETKLMRSNKICVSYNQWFTDWRYRRSLIEELGYDFDEYWIINVVAKIGIVQFEDHTFDGLKFDGRAQEMKVLERWKHFRYDPVYRLVFDEEMRDLSRRIFGDICDL